MSNKYITSGERWLNKRGELVEIEYDYGCENPRDDEGNCGHFFTFLHDRFSPDGNVTVSDAISIADLDGEYDGECYEYGRLWDKWYWANELYLEWQRENEAWQQDLRKWQREFLHWCNVVKLYGATGEAPEPPEPPTVYPKPEPLTVSDPSENKLAWLIVHANEAGHIALPVFRYVDHYSVGEATTDLRFAGDADGIIFIRSDEIEHEWGQHYEPDKAREIATEYLKTEVRVYSEWANGNTYGYYLFGEDGNEVDSCWGFIGSDPEWSGLDECCGGLVVETDLTVDEWWELCNEVNDAARDILDGLTAEYDGYEA